MQRSARLVRPLYASIFLEGLFYTALAPLLPGLKSDLGLTTAQVGFLAAGYVTGAVFGAVPAALGAARVGVKTCTVAGVALIAGGTLAFGLCETYPLLLASQLIAGVGATAMWVGAGSWLLKISPPTERGAIIGTAVGVAAFGEIVGPGLGGLAATVGRSLAFTCLAGFALFLAVAVLRSPAPPPGAPSLGIRSAAASKRVRLAAGLVAAPPVVWGALLVVGTLQLDHQGASPAAIAVVYVISGVLGVGIGPLVGDWSDRRGRLGPIRLGLLVCIPTLVALSWTHNRWATGLLIVCAICGIRVTLTPAFALLTDACQTVGGNDVLAFALSIPANAIGFAFGTALSGALAQAAGASWTYNAFAAGVLVVLLAVRGQKEEAVPGLREPSNRLAGRARATAE